MPGSSYIGPATATSTAALTASNTAADQSDPNIPIINTSGCRKYNCEDTIPGAWMPPWSVTSKAGGVNYIILIEDAVSNYNSNDGFVTGDETVRDNQSGSLTTLSEYMNDPDSYPDAFDIIAGYPLTDYSSCKALRDDIYSLPPIAVLQSGWNDFEYSYTPIGGSSGVTRDGCPDGLYNLYGETQTSSSGIIYISGEAVQCTWESVV